MGFCSLPSNFTRDKYVIWSENYNGMFFSSSQSSNEKQMWLLQVMLLTQGIVTAGTEAKMESQHPPHKPSWLICSLLRSQHSCVGILGTQEHSIFIPSQHSRAEIFLRQSCSTHLELITNPPGAWRCGERESAVFQWCSCSAIKST